MPCHMPVLPYWVGAAMPCHMTVLPYWVACAASPPGHADVCMPAASAPRLLGEAWSWGQYRLDRVVAAGAVDSREGLALEELSVHAGPAQLLLTGSLLCAKQVRGVKGG